MDRLWKFKLQLTIHSIQVLHIPTALCWLGVTPLRKPVELVMLVTGLRNQVGPSVSVRHSLYGSNKQGEQVCVSADLSANCLSVCQICCLSYWRKQTDIDTLKMCTWSDKVIAGITSNIITEVCTF